MWCIAMWQITFTFLCWFSITNAILKQEYQDLDSIDRHELGSADRFQYNLDHSEHLFGQFMAKYSKKYESKEEYNKRHTIFRENLLKYNKLNKNSKTARYGINKFSDVGETDAKQHVSCLGVRNGTTSIPVEVYKPQGGAPDTWDWRTKNVVTPVKRQGLCGSWHIFSAIGNIEGQYAKKYNKLESFSEQQALDCDKLDDGCWGGCIENVFKTLIEQKGVVLESNYPYQEDVYQCRTNKSQIVAKISGYKILNITDEDALKDAVYNIGPLAVAMDFSNTLLFYSHGISDPKDCDEEGKSHAVTLVGYGVEENTPYWLIKNQWGEDYGEKGYVRIIRGKRICNILSHVLTSNVE